MNNNKIPAILYIDHDSCFYYTAGIQPLSFAFPPEILADQDIINRDKFQELVLNFIALNKIAPTLVAFVFSQGMSYEKIYDGTTALTEKDNQEIKSFIELVPFEEVLNKTYKLGKKTIVVGLNKELVESMKLALEKASFSVASTVPYVVLQEMIPELAEQVNFDILLSRFDLIRQNNMMEQISASAESHPLITNEKPKNNKRTFTLVGVFAVLLVVFIYMLFTSVLVPPKTTPKKPSIRSPQIPIPSVVSQEKINTSTNGVPVGTTSSSSSGTVIQPR